MVESSVQIYLGRHSFALGCKADEIVFYEQRRMCTYVQTSLRKRLI